MIGLSINEDTKLEKGKGKKSSAARYFVWSSGHVTAYCSRLSETVCDCPPQSTVFHQCRNNSNWGPIARNGGQCKGYYYSHFRKPIGQPLVSPWIAISHILKAYACSI